MSIEAKHAYRFGYLQSEQWQTVRIEALAREKGCCQLCKEFSISNDAHHLQYPANVWETRADDLAILCRPCHQMTHKILEVHAVKNHTKQQFFDLINVLGVWAKEKKNQIAVAAADPFLRTEVPCCKICRRPSAVLEERFIFGRHGFAKFKFKVCDSCYSDAVQKFHSLDELPDKAYKLFEDWKKIRRAVVG